VTDNAIITSGAREATEIGDLYRKARGSLIDSIRYAIQCGQRLKAKKDSLGYGAWLPWLREHADVLGMNVTSTPQRLMKLAADSASTQNLDEARALVISRRIWGNDDNSTNSSERDNGINLDSILRDEDGKLTPEAKQALAPIIREVRAEKVEAKKENRAALEAALGTKQLALPQKKYGVILADPEWHFELYGASGMLSHPANHYPTSDLADIKARDVPSIAADDCILFLWATVPMLPHALEVMQAWGFEYKSHFAWVKDKAGTGYWNRNQHEVLLVGTKGDVPAPAPGTQWSSVIEANVGDHSEKPEKSLELIEHYFPTLPKIELNRRGPARPGWDAWGNEAGECGTTQLRAEDRR
jgi:N6-adenosine-specific RNA methylase IME4